MRRGERVASQIALIFLTTVSHFTAADFRHQATCVPQNNRHCGARHQAITEPYRKMRSEN
jgi:hypothetical protein